MRDLIFLWELRTVMSTKCTTLRVSMYENHDIAIAMSYSRADPVLGLNILQG